MSTPVPAPLTLRSTTRTYPGRPDQVRQIRADLRAALDNCPIADDVILCASELAANAAIHSNSRLPSGTITVRAQAEPTGGVRIEVQDDGGPWAEQAPDPAHGRGLNIIRSLAHDWGITTSETGRTVWAILTSSAHE